MDSFSEFMGGMDDSADHGATYEAPLTQRFDGGAAAAGAAAATAAAPPPGVATGQRAFEDPGTVFSSGYSSPSRPRRFGASDSLRGVSNSAPLLHTAHSTHTNSWYCSSYAGSDRSVKRPSWRPLGDTFRQWENDPHGTGQLSRHNQLRSCADDGRNFIQGCVPHWGKEASIRMKSLLEHEFTWAYYRMRRHAGHPLRREVGDPSLPTTDVSGEMRSGQGSMFQFWRDLRPPFSVSEVRRADDWHPGHPDGKLFKVTYLCGIDYVNERAWGEKQDGGTFDNKIQGIAQVRIPDGFPKKRPLQIVSWGRPKLNSPSDAETEEEAPLELAMVPPEKWMPIADELGQRADSPKLAACREASKRAVPRKGVQVPPLQKLLLGPHASLPRLAEVEMQRDPRMSADEERGCSFGGKPKKRQHRIFTSAAGFVRYAG